MKKIFKLTYEKNRDALLKYKFWRGNVPLPEFGELNFQAEVINAEENIFSTRDVKNQTLGEEYKIIQTKQPQKPFFRDLSKQLLVKNEFNSCHFDYLVSNVRRSEDYGADNHIYMFYDSPEIFYLLLQTVEVSKFLKDEKIIFLIGEEDLQKNYPLDFKKLYGIDYSEYKPQPIKIEELNRLYVYMQLGGCYGNLFCEGILDGHKNIIQFVPSSAFNAFSFAYLHENFLKDKTVQELKDNLKKITDDTVARIFHFISLPPNKVTTHQIDFLDENGEKNFAVTDLKNLFDNLQKFFPVDYKPTMSEWFKSLYLACAQIYKFDFNDRVSPMICLETCTMGWDDTIRKDVNYGSAYAIFREFKFLKMISSVRHFTRAIGSQMQMYYNDDNFRYVQSHWIPFYFQRILDYFITRNHNFKVAEPREMNVNSLLIKSDDEFLPYRAVVRFEDLKLYPKATIESLCDFLDIEWSDSLLQITLNGRVFGLKKMSTKDIISGFDTAAVYHLHEKIFSPFDHYRIELISEAYMPYYGYKSVYHTDGVKYTPEEIEKLCEVHFKFEDVLNQNKTDSEYNDYIWIAKKMFTETVRAHFAMGVGKTEDGEDLVPIPWLKPKKEFMKDGDELFTNGIQVKDKK